MNRPTARLPDGTHLGRTALVVGDLDEVAAFYRDVVGLALLDRSATTATLGAAETPLLVLREDDNEPPRPQTASGLYHNAFAVPSREALGDALERIRTNWRLDGASDHGFSEALYLSDPEGNGVEIYRDRPLTQWPQTDGELAVVSHALDLAALSAAAGGGNRTVPPETTLGHVHLESSSVAAARRFYAETLGFEVTIDLEPSAVFVAAGGYHHHVAANAWQGRTTSASGRGLAWFEVVVPDDDALEGVSGRLAAADHPVEKREKGVAVEDPDGIEVRVRSEVSPVGSDEPRDR